MTEGGIRLTPAAKQLPKVSIITVVMNAGAHFERYMAAITPYLSPDVELIMLDGNSTDGTLYRLTQNNDKIDYWRSEADKGIYDAMNQAVKYARGKWLYFLGIDDTLMDGFTNAVAALTNANTVYYGNVMHHGQAITRVYDDYFLTKLNFCHQALFYPRAVFDKYNYTTSYVVYADYFLNLNLWKDPAFPFVHLDYMIASFPDGGFSTTTTDKLFERNRDELFKRYLTAHAYYRYLNRTIGFWGMFKRILING